MDVVQGDTGHQTGRSAGQTKRLHSLPLRLPPRLALHRDSELRTHSDSHTAQAGIPSKSTGRHRLKVQGWKLSFKLTGPKKGGNSSSHTRHTDFRVNKVTNGEDGRYLMLRGSINHEDLTRERRKEGTSLLFRTPPLPFLIIFLGCFLVAMSQSGSGSQRVDRREETQVLRREHRVPLSPHPQAAEARLPRAPQTPSSTQPRAEPRAEPWLPQCGLRSGVTALPELLLLSQKGAPSLNSWRGQRGQ